MDKRDREREWKMDKEKVGEGEGRDGERKEDDVERARRRRRAVATYLEAAQGSRDAREVLTSLHRRGKGRLVDVLVYEGVVGIWVYVLWAYVCGGEDERLDALLEEWSGDGGEGGAAAVVGEGR